MRLISEGVFQVLRGYYLLLYYLIASSKRINLSK